MRANQAGVESGVGRASLARSSCDAALGLTSSVSRFVDGLRPATSRWRWLAAVSRLIRMGRKRPAPRKHVRLG
jgi:hypothetical protein